MRKVLIVLWMLLVPITTASAQVSIGIGLPGISIGINLPVYPELVRVPGYPVYYAPRLDSNYFFYDGMYWLYQEDSWYASSWYNGPWVLVSPGAVPLFILRIPVRYYRHPPAYFRGWSPDVPPRWADHWGNDWEQSHRGWDSWNRRAVPAPAPLPIYQRQYSGNRYPHVEQQQVLERQHYRYQPRDPVVRQHFQAQQVQRAPAASPPARQVAPPQTRSPQQGQRASSPPSSRRQAVPCPAPRRPEHSRRERAAQRFRGPLPPRHLSHRLGATLPHAASDAAASPAPDAAATARGGTASAAGTQGERPGQGVARQGTARQGTRKGTEERSGVVRWER